MRAILSRSVVILAAAAGAYATFAQAPLTSEFSYQGRLNLANAPANGQHDLRFTLHSAASGAGNIVAGPICKDAVDVVDGLFTVVLDFGVGSSNFDGEARWLSIEVRADATPGNCAGGAYTALSPREPLTAAPYAFTALNASHLNNQDSGFYRNAANINAGALSDDRLSTNVCLLDREQVFTDSKHFDATAYFNSPTLPFAIESSGRVPNLNADLLDGLDSAALRQFGTAGQHIFSLNAGNVGIGTAIPPSKLSVQGGLHLYDDLDEDVVFYTSNYSIRETDYQHLAYRYMSDPEQHEFYIEGLPRVTLAASGSLGLGTTDPTALLHLKPRLDQTAIRLEADRYDSTPTSEQRSNATVTQMSGSGATWTNPGFASSINGASALATLINPGDASETRQLDFRNLGFNIPANATIRGVRVRATGQATGSCSGCAGGGWLDYVKHAQLASGAALSAQRFHRGIGLDGNIGGVNDMWGLALTPAVVNAPTFGVRLWVELLPMSTYTPPTGGGSSPIQCPSCAATSTISLDGITVTIEYGSPTVSHAEYTVGVGEFGTDFRISPSPDFSASGFSMDQQGIINFGPGQGIIFNVYGGAAKQGGGTWASTSDRRLKQNIEPLAGTLDRLLTLHGYSFEYTNQAIAQRHGWPGRHMGLIAQEVEKVFPDWIDYTPDGYRMVTERATTALMVEALRELRAEKDQQLADRDAQIASLTARLERLESALEHQVGETESATGTKALKLASQPKSPPSP